MISLLAAAALATHPLDLVMEKATQTIDRGQTPVIVFDIDDTLTDSRYRTFEIFQTLAGDQSLQRLNRREMRLLSDMTVSDVEYWPEDTLEKLGVHNPQLVKILSTEWAKRFFSNDYLWADRVIPGAREYLHELARTGVQIVYLTGRDQERLGQTGEYFFKKGFPRGTLIMKEHASIPDEQYKGEAIQKIRRLGRLIAVFENEPTNLNRILDQSPQSIGVLLSTRHSPKAELPYDSILTIPNFL